MRSLTGFTPFGDRLSRNAYISAQVLHVCATRDTAIGQQRQVPHRPAGRGPRGAQAAGHRGSGPRRRHLLPLQVPWQQPSQRLPWPPRPVTSHNSINLVSATTIYPQRSKTRVRCWASAGVPSCAALGSLLGCAAWASSAPSLAGPQAHRTRRSPHHHHKSYRRSHRPLHRRPLSYSSPSERVLTSSVAAAAAVDRPLP